MASRRSARDQSPGAGASKKDAGASADKKDAGASADPPVGPGSARSDHSTADDDVKSDSAWTMLCYVSKWLAVGFCIVCVVGVVGYMIYESVEDIKSFIEKLRLCFGEFLCSVGNIVYTMFSFFKFFTLHSDVQTYITCLSTGECMRPQHRSYERMKLLCNHNLELLIAPRGLTEYVCKMCQHGDPAVVRRCKTLKKFDMCLKTFDRFVKTQPYYETSWQPNYYAFCHTFMDKDVIGNKCLDHHRASGGTLDASDLHAGASAECTKSQDIVSHRPSNNGVSNGESSSDRTEDSRDSPWYMEVIKFMVSDSAYKNLTHSMKFWNEFLESIAMLALWSIFTYVMSCFLWLWGLGFVTSPPTKRESVRWGVGIYSSCLFLMFLAEKLSQWCHTFWTSKPFYFFFWIMVLMCVMCVLRALYQFFCIDVRVSATFNKVITMDVIYHKAITIKIFDRIKEWRCGARFDGLTEDARKRQFDIFLETYMRFFAYEVAKILVLDNPQHFTNNVDTIGKVPIDRFFEILHDYGSFAHRNNRSKTCVQLKEEILTELVLSIILLHVAYTRVATSICSPMQDSMDYWMGTELGYNTGRLLPTAKDFLKDIWVILQRLGVRTTAVPADGSSICHLVHIVVGSTKIVSVRQLGDAVLWCEK